MKIDETGRIHHFYEKPKGEGLKSMVATFPLHFALFKIFILQLKTTHLEHKMKGSNYFLMQQVDTTILGLSAEDAKQFPYIASMGIYLFKTEVLLKLLR